MTKITWKAGTLLAPVPPAMISCGTIEKPNVMTAAWTGIIASEPAMTYVSIRPSRYSHEIISQTKEFVINLTNLPLVAAADFCGVKSGRDMDKFKEMNLTALPCSQIKAPQIAESPVSIECKVVDIQHFGTHDMFLAEIVAVNIDDQYLDEEGRLALEKSGLVAYAHGHYYTMGRKLGTFGFSVNKARLKQMQKMAEVKVEVKKNREIPTSAETPSEAKAEKRINKFAKQKRNPEGRSFRPRHEDDTSAKPFRPRRDNDGARREYKPRHEDEGEKRSYRPRREDANSSRILNKFDGKKKFEKSRSESENSDFKPKKKYGNNKTFKRQKATD